uniref:Uncharacterized protein n=1 Tax=Melopsittacus undulatus TaxID=13146 RepID=A0A8V5GP71_MELUD
MGAPATGSHPSLGPPYLRSGPVMPKRDCGFYMKYIFLFTSLIQFLIILGLVLFMVYGNAQAGTDTHLRLLEEQLQDRYSKIITLGERNINLTRTLNATLKEKQNLQTLAQKVQRELEKCNSSQTPNPIPKVSTHPYGKAPRWVPGAAPPEDPQASAGMDGRVMGDPLQDNSTHGCSPEVWGGMGGREGKTHTPQPHTSPSTADKVLLRSQLDQAAQARKEQEENCRKEGALLSKATAEQESCQQELRSSQSLLESTQHNLELRKQECSTLRSEVRYSFQHIKEMLSPYSCTAVHDQLNWLTQHTERLFLWQQDRDTNYVGKSVCKVSLSLCQQNCSREKQELEKRLQGSEKQLKEGQEEKKKLLAEKEQLSKELEEKSKAAAQAWYFKDQLSICMGAKVRMLGTSLAPGVFAVCVSTFLPAQPQEAAAPSGPLHPRVLWQQGQH